MTGFEISQTKLEIQDAVNKALGSYATYVDDLAVQEVRLDPETGEVFVDIMRFFYDEPLHVFTLQLC